MSIWNKILLGFIFIAAVVFFYMATRTLATHAAWRSSAQAFEEKLEEARQTKQDLLEGIPKERMPEGEKAQMGIRQIRLELHKLMLARGRVWYADPGQRDADTGEVVVSVEMPDPHQISDKMILYVFEKGEPNDGGKYLGEFKVAGVAEKEKQVTLRPTFNLARKIEDPGGNKKDDKKVEKDKLDRLAQSKGTWILYERMPGDNHEIFAGLSDAELEELVPQELLAEYLKDGKPAEPGDPGDRVDPKTGKYVRELLDYKTVLRQSDAERSALVDLIQSEMRDRKSVQDALADAKEQTKFHEKVVVDSNEELAKMSAQRDAVLAHLQEVQSVLTAKDGQIKSTISSIQAMVGEIAKIQLEATRQINQRTRALMQAGAGQ